MIYQAQEKGCGYASVKMALAHLDKKEKWEYLEEPLIKEAPSLKGIVDFASKQGLALRAKKADRSEEITTNEIYPLLIVLLEDERQHMVFLKKKTKKGYLVYDSARGKRTLGEEELISKFTGIYLEIEGYKRKEEKIKKKPLINPIDKIASFLFPIGEVSCLCLALFLSSQESFYLPFLLLAASFCLGLAKRLHLLSAMKRFDDEYLGIEEWPIASRKANLAHYSAFKGALFGSSGIFLTGAITAFLGAFLLYFGDSSSWIFLLGTILFFLLEAIFIFPLIEKRKKRLEEEEGKYLEGADSSISARSLFGKASDVAKQESLLDLSRLFYCASLALICAFIYPPASLPRVIFLLGGYSLFLRSLEDCYKGVILAKNAKKELPYFLLHFLKRDLW